MSPAVLDRAVELLNKAQLDVAESVGRHVALIPSDLGERLSRRDAEEAVALEEMKKQVRREGRPARPRSAAELLPELRQQFPASNPKHSHEFLHGKLAERGVHVDKSTVTRTLKRLDLK